MYPTGTYQNRWYKVFHEADTGAGKAAHAAPSENVRLFMALAAEYNSLLKMVDNVTVFLHARCGPDDPDVYETPPQGFACSPAQATQVRKLKVWVHGLIPSTADPRVHIK